MNVHFAVCAYNGHPVPVVHAGKTEKLSIGSAVGVCEFAGLRADKSGPNDCVVSDGHGVSVVRLAVLYKDLRSALDVDADGVLKIREPDSDDGALVVDVALILGTNRSSRESHNFVDGDLSSLKPLEQRNFGSGADGHVERVVGISVEDELDLGGPAYDADMIVACSANVDEAEVPHISRPKLVEGTDEDKENEEDDAEPGLVTVSALVIVESGVALEAVEEPVAVEEEDSVQAVPAAKEKVDAANSRDEDGRQEMEADGDPADGIPVEIEIEKEKGEVRTIVIVKRAVNIENLRGSRSVGTAAVHGGVVEALLGSQLDLDVVVVRGDGHVRK